MSTNQAPKRQRHAGTRTCVGCGARCARTDAGEALLRVVFVPREEGLHAVVDLSGKAHGRGAWVHTRPACVAQAATKGLSRAAKAKVTATAGMLAAQVVSQAERRADSLVMAALRRRALAIGAQAVSDAMADGVAMVVVATDAAAAAKLPQVAKAQEQGIAVAWSTKAHLGALVNRGDVGVLAVGDDGIAHALRQAIALSATFAQHVD